MSERRETLLIADVGATKGSWVAIDKAGELHQISTDGFNPSSQRYELLQAALQQVHESLPTPAEVIYYGTGVTSDELRHRVSHAIKSTLGDTSTSVFSDLLGAARACCGDDPGYVAILGTGSVAKRYDGRDLFGGKPALGYPLGDEGSGWRIGQALIRGFYYQSMPKHLMADFGEQMPDSRSDLLDYIRNSPAPNRYLASFATFAGARRSDVWISETVSSCLEEFIKAHIAPLKPDSPVHFVGGVASAFEDILRSLLMKYGITPGLILNDPIEQLIKYHRKEWTTRSRE